MSDFKAKMHQIRFRLGLRPVHSGGAYSAPPGLLWLKTDLKFSRLESWSWDVWRPVFTSLGLGLGLEAN